MNRIATVLILIVFLLASPTLLFAEGASEDSLQASSQDSMQQSSQESSQQSSEQSSQQSSEQTSQNSTDETSQNTSDTSSQQSSDQTTGASSVGSTQGSSDSTAELGNASAVVLVIGGAVVAVGLTALGVTYLVNVTNARQQDALALQDQIYAGDGPDYRLMIEELGIAEEDLVRANDELVAEGYTVGSDQDAADYLVALLLRLGEIVPPAKQKGPAEKAG